MTQQESKSGTPKIETEIEIDAPVEVVWRAITEAEELTRWFPLDAPLKPGPEGSMWISWGGPYEAQASIEIWRPKRWLRADEVQPPRWRQTAEAAAKGDSEATDHQRGQCVAIPLSIDYYLESREGKTILRLVQSGFGAGSNWDDEYESIRRGWKFELRGLGHDLERHRGMKRTVAGAPIGTDVSVQQAWTPLMASGGFLHRGNSHDLPPEERSCIQAATGVGFERLAHIFGPPREFSATVEDPNDALLRISRGRMFDQTDALVSISTYGSRRINSADCRTG